MITSPGCFRRPLILKPVEGTPYTVMVGETIDRNAVTVVVVVVVLLCSVCTELRKVIENETALEIIARFVDKLFTVIVLATAVTACHEMSEPQSNLFVECLVCGNNHSLWDRL